MTVGATFQADSNRDVRLTIYALADTESARRIETLAARPARATHASRRHIEARP